MPSGLNTALVALEVWPVMTSNSLAVLASKTRAVLSNEAVIMAAPSGLNAWLCGPSRDGPGKRLIARLSESTRGQWHPWPRLRWLSRRAECRALDRAAAPD